MTSRIQRGSSPNVVQHKALSGVEGNPDVPLLPLDQVAFNGEAGSFGLHNAEGLQASPPFFLHQIAVVVDVEVWHLGRDLILLVDAHNLQNQTLSMQNLIYAQSWKFSEVFMQGLICTVWNSSKVTTESIQRCSG